MLDAGHEVLDLGTHSEEPVDYPDYARALGRAVLDGRAERGVLICGSGAGAAIAANKMRGIRAALAHDTYTAHQMVEHDDVNVCCLGARVVGVEPSGGDRNRLPRRLLHRRGATRAPSQ